MKKTLLALAAVSTLALSTIVAPAPAHAQRYLGAAIAGGAAQPRIGNVHREVLDVSARYVQARGHPNFDISPGS